MAYHGSTPASVLDAPEQSAIVVHAPKGPSRIQRRHYRPPSENSLELNKVVHFRPMLDNFSGNEPAIKTEHKDPRRNVDGSRKPRRA